MASAAGNSGAVITDRVAFAAAAGVVGHRRRELGARADGVRELTGGALLMV